MEPPSSDRLFRAMDCTWQPHAIHQMAGWRVREGRGGGKRVSAASRVSPDAEIGAAEAHHRAIGQRPLFMIREGDADLDADLAARGYQVVDPVLIYAAPLSSLADPGPPHHVISTDIPLAIQREIWEAGGVGAARIEVMLRAPAPRAFLLIRDGQRPAGCAYVAADGDVAMIHALAIRPAFRRKGLGAILTRAAAQWALEREATHFALAVTLANSAARTLYIGLGLSERAAYHYRQSPS